MLKNHFLDFQKFSEKYPFLQEKTLQTESAQMPMHPFLHINYIK